MKARRLTLAAAREVAEDFSASVTATLLKIVQVNRFPLIVACYGKSTRKWFRRAEMVPPWWFPLARLDRATFAADMLFNGASEQRWPSKIGADAWFEFRNCDRYEIEEQSFLLPGREVLTVLTIPESGLLL